jgi:hypothetical protein
MTDSETVGEALRRHYSSNGLPVDGGRSTEKWTLRLGPLILRLRNVGWRQRALERHDVHHVLTGYECTPTGEMQIATWEFAAGPFPSLRSALFCLPLVGLGALIVPRRSLTAFVRGRRSRTLYAMPASTDFRSMEVDVLRRQFLPEAHHSMTWADIILYVLLVASSLVLPATPVAVIVAARMTT